MSPVPLGRSRLASARRPRSSRSSDNIVPAQASGARTRSTGGRVVRPSRRPLQLFDAVPAVRTDPRTCHDDRWHLRDEPDGARKRRPAWRRGRRRGNARLRTLLPDARADARARAPARSVRRSFGAIRRGPKPRLLAAAFRRKSDVLGAAITLNQVPFTVVGVEPAGFRGTEVGRPYDIAMPMRARDMFAEGRPLWNEAFATWIYVMARLKPGRLSRSGRTGDQCLLPAGLARRRSHTQPGPDGR